MVVLCSFLSNNIVSIFSIGFHCIANVNNSVFFKVSCLEMS